MVLGAKACALFSTLPLRLLFFHPPCRCNDCSHKNTFLPPRILSTVCNVSCLATDPEVRSWGYTLVIFLLLESTLSDRPVGKCRCEVNRSLSRHKYSELRRRSEAGAEREVTDSGSNWGLKAELNGTRWGCPSGMVRGPHSNWNTEPQQISVGWRKLLNLQWVGGKIIREQAGHQARLVRIRSSPAAGSGSFHLLKLDQLQQDPVSPTQQTADVETQRTRSLTQPDTVSLSATLYLLVAIGGSRKPSQLYISTYELSHTVSSCFISLMGYLSSFLWPYLWCI